MNRLIPLVLAVALVAAACGDDSSSTETGGPGGDGPTTTTSTTVATTTTLDPATPEGELAAARQRWAESGLDSYRLETAEICFCPETRWTNTVVDGEVTDHAPLSDEAVFDPGPRTMETLFDSIARAIEEGYETLDAEYDAETGAVVSYYVDVEANMADEEYGVSVTSLTPYDPDAPTVEIDAGSLVDDYGCGYGFEKGSADQTLRLSLEWVAGFDAEPIPIDGPVTLPAEGWNALLLTGADLYANWCDDVIEPDEPEPVIASRWTVVEGTVTITSPTPLTAEGRTDVTAVLEGGVVESGTGERVDLDDITLRNDCWGCFAG